MLLGRVCINFMLDSNVAEGMDEKVKPGNIVEVRYTGRLDSGVVFDSNVEGEPLKFEVGAGVVIPGFDKAVLGLAPGESRTVKIPPEEAYGTHREDLIMDVEKKLFEGNPVDTGMQVDLSDSSGARYRAKVVDIGESTVKLDLNHELAGETLTFDVRLETIG